MGTIEELAVICRMLVGHWYVRLSIFRILTVLFEGFSGFNK